ncbi:MAG: hypothetical protein GY870_01625 [archaeon]|nr:hypothetical protein [archaeon]
MKDVKGWNESVSRCSFTKKKGKSNECILWIALNVMHVLFVSHGKCSNYKENKIKLMIAQIKQL